MTRLCFDSGKLIIRVCGGVNCACSGGGHPLAEALQSALEDADAADQVELLCAHCLGDCQHGPCVRMAGERFYHVQAEDVHDLVRVEILPKLK